VLTSIWRQLSTLERFKLLNTLVARVALVIFDLGGVALVGIAVAVATGTRTSASSLTGTMTQVLGRFGVQNPYAIIAVAAVLFFCLKAIFSMILNRYMATFIANLEIAKANALYVSMLRNDLDHLDEYSQSKLSFALLGSTAAAFNLSISSFSIVFGEVVMITGVAAYLFSVNALLLLLVALYLGAMGWLMNVLTAGRNRVQAKRLATETVASQSLINDTHANFRQLAVSKSQNAFIHAFRTSRARVAHAQAEISILNVLPRYITEIALMIGLGLLVGQRSLIGSSAISATTIAVFVAGSFRIVASLLPLQGAINLLRQVEELGRPALDMSAELEQTAAPQDPLSKAQSENPTIKFAGVSHAYGDGKVTFSDLNLEIPFGSKVLVTGPSGVGKSTLLDLLLGLRKPKSGEVTIGRLAPEDFSRISPVAVGYVSQTAPLIEATVKENITLNLGGASLDAGRLSAAVRIAALDTVIESLPQGMDTLLKPGLLSGGQTQRIAIARAIYEKPGILILDEATSSLDKAAANRVMAEIIASYADKTLIVVAHNEIEFEGWDMTLDVVAGKVQISRPGL
jgi:ABC-type multidrug transport system fused ATPase/permease subunit